jgi:hypothetical protein
MIHDASKRKIGRSEGGREAVEGKGWNLRDPGALLKLSCFGDPFKAFFYKESRGPRAFSEPFLKGT